MQRTYWRRTVKHATFKYLGWDWRFIPLLGLIGSLIPIFLIKELWVKFAIGYVPVAIIWVCSALAQHYVWKEDTTKLSIINDQKNNPNKFISARFSHLYLRNDQQVDIEVEWFNQTLFGLSFESAHDGTVKINDLQRKVTSNDKRSCSPSSISSYTITLVDKDIVELIRESISNNRPVKLFLVFSIGGIVHYEWDRKPESSSPLDVQCWIDNISVIPQKV